MRADWIPLIASLLNAAAFAAILLILCKHKLRSAFPIFFTYISFGLLMVAVALPVYLRTCSCATSYFYVYWTLTTLFMLLEFGVMYEIFVNALKPHAALIDLGKMLFRWAALFLLITAVLTAAATSGSEVSKMTAAVALVERSIRLIECGFLLLFFLFERRLGLSWRNPCMSIGLGLGVSAAVGLCMAYLFNHYPGWTMPLRIIDQGSYFGILVFWLFCLTQNARSRASGFDLPGRLIFKRWNETLADSTLAGANATRLLPNTVSSFIPGVEQAVDRVLSRRVIQ
ncbi:MAG TPA: hypothetical protein VEW69_08245 [Alphaproteobacteria bacterium]|nr:hypothetical protein [Alphaproteobacteria bacterium]